MFPKRKPQKNDAWRSTSGDVAKNKERKIMLCSNRSMILVGKKQEIYRMLAEALMGDSPLQGGILEWNSLLFNLIKLDIPVI